MQSKATDYSPIERLKHYLNCRCYDDLRDLLKEVKSPAGLERWLTDNIPSGQGEHISILYCRTLPHLNFLEYAN